MLRQAAPDDIPAIHALMESTPGFWQPHWSGQTLAQAIKAAEGLAFVWEADAEILGFVCAHDAGFRVYVSALIVAERVHHQGIGALLLQRIELEATQRGRTILIVDAWHESVPFYRSLGWEPPDAVLLRKRIERDIG